MRFRNIALSSLLIGLFAASSNAGPIDAIYAFGDSLSDAGNVYAGTGGLIPGAPYSQGRFSNGPVWVQDLAASLGVGPVTASLTGGTDFAYGSAESGTTPVHTGTALDLTGSTGQLAQFHLLNPVADPKALYTIWIGSNDLADILTGASPSQYAADSAAVIVNIDSAITALAGYGAKNIMVLTVPDLGKTPAALAQGSLAAATTSQLAAGFDQALVKGSAAANLPSLQALALAEQLNLSVIDTYSLIDALTANPGAYGFTDVTDPCLVGAVNYRGGTPCSSPNSYLFWDSLHPTAAGHALIAEDALASLTPTPEPTCAGLLGAGLIGLFLVRRQKA